MTPKKTLHRTAFAFLLALAPLTALAGEPNDYIYTPHVEYGERELDFKLGSWQPRNQPRLGAGSVGIGYGATQHWFTEFYTKYERPGDQSTHFDAWEWENKFQLTEEGEYPVDAGFVVEIEKPQDHSEGYETRFGPLFQTDIGTRIQLNANFLLERNYRAETSEQTAFGYQWQAKYRWRPQLEFGFQGFGETGQWDNWDPQSEQSHRMGPALFGKVPLGGRQAIRYNTAWLIGTSSAAPRNNFRLQIEYEFF